MHELAIAQNLIESATAALVGCQAAKIHRVRVRLGPLAGVSGEELQFGFGVMGEGTPFANALLEIDEISAIVRCRACGVESVLEKSEPLLCPACGSATVQVIQGKELTLMSIEVSDGNLAE